jgi:hypothetical protein
MGYGTKYTEKLTSRRKLVFITNKHSPPARHVHQPAGLHVLGRTRAVNHDHVAGARGMNLPILFNQTLKFD